MEENTGGKNLAVCKKKALENIRFFRHQFETDKKRESENLKSFRATFDDMSEKNAKDYLSKNDFYKQLWRLTSKRVDDSFETINSNLLSSQDRLEGLFMYLTKCLSGQGASFANMFVSASNVAHSHAEVIFNTIMCYLCVIEEEFFAAHQVETENYADLCNKIATLSDKIDALINLGNQEGVEVKPDKTKDDLKASCKPREKKPFTLSDEELLTLTNGYDEDDSYGKYSAKIKTMCKYVAAYDKHGIEPTKVLSEAYIRARDKYGMVLQDLRKNFEEQEDRAPVSNLEAVYKEEIFRGIVYIIVAEICEAIYKEQKIEEKNKG